MSVKIRDYEHVNQTTGVRKAGWEADIRFDWPDGSPFRRRYKAPVNTAGQAERWGSDLERRIYAGGPDGLLAKSKRAKEGGGASTVANAIEVANLETVSQCYERYYIYRESKTRGAESVSDSRGRFKKWIEPQIGARSMATITRTVLEDLVTYLDGQVDDEVIAAKTASNIWGEVSAGFKVATKCKDRTLRVLEANPADAVEGPDKEDGKQKPFLRPDEVVKLLGHNDVPLERRRVYALAIYTAMRQGELRGVRVGDVDLAVMQITVVRQIRDGVEKDRTKTGRARIIQIEPALVPLLRPLIDGKKRDDLVLFVGTRNRCAAYLRSDLRNSGCDREALHVGKGDPMRARMKFHNLRDTCLTHMAVRRDAPQDIQWRAGHTTSAMTEAYITNARYQAGASFGTPLPPLPPTLFGEPVENEAAE